MRVKIISVPLIFTLIFFSIIIHVNYGLIANYSENNSSSITINQLGNKNFDWEQITVISEPFSDLNINIGYSRSCDMAVENNKIYVELLTNLG